MLSESSTNLIIAISRQCSLSISVEVDCHKQQTYYFRLHFLGFAIASLFMILVVSISHRSSCSIPGQNRRQKVVNRGALRLCGEAWQSNSTKLPLICSVSYLNLGGLKLCLGGLNPPKPPVATGLYLGWPNLLYV